MRLATLLFTFLPFLAFAQLFVDGRIRPSYSAQQHRLVTKRGDVFIGNVRNYKDGKVEFKSTGANLMIFDFSHVDSITLVPYAIKNHGGFDHAERVMFLPTAFSLEMGEWEYVNRNLVANSLNYGVRDNFTAGIGAMPMPNGFASWVNIKLSKQLAKGIHVATGATMSLGRYNSYLDFEGSSHESYRLLAPYGLLTVGTKNIFVNLVATKGWTYQYADPEVTDLMWGLSCAAKLNSRFQVFAEWSKTMPPYFNDKYLNLGFAILGKKRCLTLGILKAEDYDGIVPTLGFSSKRMAKRFR
jgi:hypothetical protein